VRSSGHHAEYVFFPIYLDPVVSSSSESLHRAIIFMRFATSGHAGCKFESDSCVGAPPAAKARGVGLANAPIQVLANTAYRSAFFVRRGRMINAEHSWKFNLDP
jgi:hypothetical protein